MPTNDDQTVYEREGRVTLYLGQSMKAKIEEAAAQVGQSMNKYIRVAVQRRYNNERRARARIALQQQEETK